MKMAPVVNLSFRLLIYTKPWKHD